MKTMSSKLILLVAALLISTAADVGAQTLKFATINFWSGIDYKGSWKMGEYETPEAREKRFQVLLSEVKSLQPDILALQESNPIHETAARLASDLDYDYVYQRSNGGIKIGRLGIPTNLNEGLALLAKKELELQLYDVWDLSKTMGAFGNHVSFHFDDQNIALVGTITVEGKKLYVVNVHLSSAVPDDSMASVIVESLVTRGVIAKGQEEHLRSDLRERSMLRAVEINRLLNHLKHIDDLPVVLLGDFNADPAQPEMNLIRNAGYTDAATTDAGSTQATWDPIKNPNIRYSTKTTDAGGNPLTALDLVGAAYDLIPRRIDYVFLCSRFQLSDVKRSSLFAEKPTGGVLVPKGWIPASDHFGVFVEVDLQRVISSAPETLSSQTDWDALPILTYDTDVGFGYGAKAFLLNYLGNSESFDLIAFTSTKGERWYRFVFSLPDFELRQGTRYPWSVDLIVDYDKYLLNNFYDVGNGSRKDDRETYTKEPLEIQTVVGRGFSPRLVAQVGLRFKSVRNLNYADTSRFATLPNINHGRSNGLTLFSSVRYDSRNSFINPSTGNVAQFDIEAGSRAIIGDYSFWSSTLTLQTYKVLFYPKTVLALRWMGQAIGGSELPIHTFASLGGNRALRGFPQDRFVDRTMMLMNIETRFPIIWRFDGVLFYDTGKVWKSLSQIDLRRWQSNSGFGLRVVLDTFIVRVDLGTSREGVGFYLNFGHVF